MVILILVEGEYSLNEDRSLVSRLQQGDELAFERIYEKYSRLLFHIVFLIVEDKDDTNDLVQDTFMAVIDRIYTFNANNNFKYWLIQIARNKALDFLRKRKRINYNIDVDELLYQKDYMREKTDFELMMNQYQKVINKDEFNIITLHLFHQLKFKEIAKIYDKTTSSVNNIYCRGIKKIKKHLKRTM